MFSIRSELDWAISLVVAASTFLPDERLGRYDRVVFAFWGWAVHDGSRQPVVSVAIEAASSTYNLRALLVTVLLDMHLQLRLRTRHLTGGRARGVANATSYGC